VLHSAPAAPPPGRVSLLGDARRGGQVYRYRKIYLSIQGHAEITGVS